MSRYIQTADGRNLTPEQFKSENRNVHFSGFPSADYLASVGAVVITPPPPDKYPDIQSARVAMVGYIDALTKQITDDYPASEVASWGSKAEAARAVDAGTARADQTAMIQDEADITGRTLAEQATSILGKAVIFEEIIAKASGLRQVTEIALAEATTSDEREVILDAAIAQAEAILAPFGIT